MHLLEKGIPKNFNRTTSGSLASLNPHQGSIVWLRARKKTPCLGTGRMARVGTKFCKSEKEKESRKWQWDDEHERRRAEVSIEVGEEFDFGIFLSQPPPKNYVNMELVLLLYLDHHHPRTVTYCLGLALLNGFWLGSWLFSSWPLGRLHTHTTTLFR